MASKKDARIIKRVRAIWKKLTSPSPWIENPDQQQQTRLLLSLLLLIIMPGLPIVLLSVWLTQPQISIPALVLIGLINLVIFAGFYRFSRQGYHQVCGLLAPVYGSLVLLAGAALLQNNGGVQLLYYLMAAPLFGSLVLSGRQVAIIIGLQITGMTALALVLPRASSNALVAGPFGFNLAVGVMIGLVISYYRRLETRRRVWLTTSEKQYRNLIEDLRDMVFTQSVTGEITSLNSAAARLLGCTQEELIGKSVLDFIHPDDLPLALALFRHMLKGSPPPLFELRLQTHSGSYVWVEFKATPIMEAGRLLSITGVARDITERKQMESVLRETNHMFQVVVTNSPLPIIILNRDTRVTLWNPAAERIFGWKEREILNQLYPLVPKDRLPEYQGFLDEVINQGRTLLSRETHRQRKDGSLIDVSISGGPVRNAQGSVTGIIVLFEDITERKLAEASIRESEERYRIISESISDYAYAKRVEADGIRHIEWVTDSFETITGYNKDELISGHNTTLYHPDDADLAFQHVQQVLQGQPISADYRIITKNRQVRWLRVYRRPVWDTSLKRVVRYYGVAQDITERKEAEAALKASEERYRIISELISDYAYSTRIDENGIAITEWMTSSLSAVTGYSGEEARFQRPFSTYHPDDIEQVQADIQQVLQGHSVSGEYRYVAQDGRIHWLRMYRRPAWDEDHQRVFRYYTVAQDITERKEAEAALKASEERYRIVSELISDYAYSVRIHPDDSMSYEWMTDSFKTVTGYNWEDMNPNDPFSLYYPDDYEIAKRDIQLVKQGKTVTSEYRIVTRSGQTRWVLISRHPVWNAAENRVTHYYGVAQDITERKEAEAQKMRLALQRERLMLLGQFVRAVSHDFRTTLANIETSRYLIERQLNPDERLPIQPRLDRIQVSVKRLTSQLENLYSVSAVANPNTDLCDINGLIDALLDEQRGLAYQKKVALNFDRHPFLPLIPANAEELKRALQHLLLNALNFTPESGQVTLRTSRANDSIIIEVHDTGVGIAEENQPFIFDLFYRADTSRTIESGGIGLGLSIVKMIVEAHGGQITVDSVLGHGTLFVISLPISQLDTPIPEPHLAHLS